MTNCITFSAKISFDNLIVMKVALFGVVFVALVLRANCDNDDEIRVKLQSMEKRLAKMDTMEKRLAKMDNMEKHLAKMDAMEKCLAKMDAVEERQELMERREEVTNKRLAAVEQHQGKDSFKPNKN